MALRLHIGSGIRSAQPGPAGARHPQRPTEEFRRAGTLIQPTARVPGGRTVFATSSLVGIAGASLISRAWSPESWQTPSGTARSMAISVAGAAGLNIRLFIKGFVDRIKAGWKSGGGSDA